MQKVEFEKYISSQMDRLVNILERQGVSRECDVCWSAFSFLLTWVLTDLKGYCFHGITQFAQEFASLTDNVSIEGNSYVTTLNAGWNFSMHFDIIYVQLTFRYKKSDLTVYATTRTYPSAQALAYFDSAIPSLQDETRKIANELRIRRIVQKIIRTTR